MEEKRNKQTNMVIKVPMVSSAVEENSRMREFNNRLQSWR